MAKSFSLPVCNHKPRPYTGPSKAEVLALRQQYLTPALITYYKEPFMAVEGHMQYLWDERARAISTPLPHRHRQRRPLPPQGRRASAIKSACSSTRRRSTSIPTVGQYGKKLAEHMPGDLKVTYFTNSGSEANDLAILFPDVHRRLT
jgi:alanine-glyoxylate transaminase/(R)-3-amino-2-methylpropionate-pyruvate transaminase